MDGDTAGSFDICSSWDAVISSIFPKNGQGAVLEEGLRSGEYLRNSHPYIIGAPLTRIRIVK